MGRQNFYIFVSENSNKVVKISAPHPVHSAVPNVKSPFEMIKFLILSKFDVPKRP